MATKRDLVEAHAFSRRRLVTAFVSGAPGGREVEPVRPGRTIVGGLALSVLLIAGAVIAGVFAPRSPADWQRPGLILSKEQGAPYAITEEADPPVLRPVINITSAKLIFGSDADDPPPIPQEVIDQQQIGENIGILGAPAVLPSVGRLIGTGWTACVDADSGIRLNVATSPDVVSDPKGALVVKARGSYYLIAEATPEGAAGPSAFRYLLPGPGGPRDNMLAELGLRASTYHTVVPEDWLSLFPAGGSLGIASMRLDGVGDAAPQAGGSSGVPADAVIGDIVDDGTSVLVLTTDGPAELDPFALAVYRNLPKPHEPRELTIDEPLNVSRVRAPYAPADWPQSLLRPVTGEQCGQLIADPDGPPRVAVVTGPGPDESAQEVPFGGKLARVEEAGGALVSSGSWAADSPVQPYLVDARAQAYALIGPDTAGLLGYGDYAPPRVPDSWIELFDLGVSLSREAALCPPRPTPGETCD